MKTQWVLWTGCVTVLLLASTAGAAGAFGDGASAAPLPVAQADSCDPGEIAVPFVGCVNPCLPQCASAGAPPSAAVVIASTPGPASQSDICPPPPINKPCILAKPVPGSMPTRGLARWCSPLGWLCIPPEFLQAGSARASVAVGEICTEPPLPRHCEQWPPVAKSVDPAPERSIAREICVDPNQWVCILDDAGPESPAGPAAFPEVEVAFCVPTTQVCIPPEQAIVRDCSVHQLIENPHVFVDECVHAPGARGAHECPDPMELIQNGVQQYVSECLSPAPSTFSRGFKVGSSGPCPPIDDLPEMGPIAWLVQCL